VVTRAEFADDKGIVRSREVGLLSNFFQGPGESPDINGDGSGVTSAIALSMGEDKAELGADVMLPALLAKTFLMLGVRAIPICFGAASEKSLEFRAVFALAAVTVQPGMISVCILSPALNGLDRPPSGVYGDGVRRVEVSREESVEGSLERVDICGGGEGAIVFDVKVEAVF